MITSTISINRLLWQARSLIPRYPDGYRKVLKTQGFIRNRNIEYINVTDTDRVSAETQKYYLGEKHSHSLADFSSTNPDFPEMYDIRVKNTMVQELRRRSDIYRSYTSL